MRIADGQQCARDRHREIHSRSLTEAPVVEIATEIAGRDRINEVAFAGRDADDAEMRPQRNIDSLQNVVATAHAARHHRHARIIISAMDDTRRIGLWFPRIGILRARVRRRGVLEYRSFAEYDIADEDAIVALPEALRDEPFPGEPFGCAMNIFARANEGRGDGRDHRDRISRGYPDAVATEAGARVIAISRRAFSYLARRMGAAQTIAMEDHGDIINRVSTLTQGRFCDVVIEAVGKQWPLDLGAELTAERGRRDCGISSGWTASGEHQLWNWRGLDVINAHERERAVYSRGVRDAVQAVVEGRLDIGSLLTNRFSLEQLGEALNATRDRPDGFVKALVMM